MDGEVINDQSHLPGYDPGDHHDDQRKHSLHPGDDYDDNDDHGDHVDHSLHPGYDSGDVNDDHIIIRVFILVS